MQEDGRNVNFLVKRVPVNEDWHAVATRGEYYASAADQLRLSLDEHVTADRENIVARVRAILVLLEMEGVQIRGPAEEVEMGLEEKEGGER